MKKVYSSFKENILGVDREDMQLISKQHFVINIFSKYGWVVCVEDKRGITITNAFPKKIRWVYLQTKQNMDG